ncbi:MAG: ferritin family protein [Pseudomonadota bacterium]
MSVYNIDEIFEIALKIEKDGAAFYRKAAEGSFDDRSKVMLLKLAEMEDDHQRIFQDMREEFADGLHNEVYNPDDQVTLYLKAIASGKVFNFDDDPAKSLTGGESKEEFLMKAIQLEKDSIVFYLGIKGLVPEHLGGKKVDNIIKEEMKHVSLLSERLNQL